jgi:hypothetical protein
MERDDLHEAWASLEAHLQRTERLNDLLVTHSMTQGAQTTLARGKHRLVAEIALNYIAVVALGAFAADRSGQIATIVSAAILAASLIAINVVLIGIALAIGRLDYEEPVVAIQTALERIQMRRARLTAITLVAGPLLWPPMLVVLLSLFGLDAFHVLGIPYLAANAAFGLTVGIFAWVAARRFGSRFARSRWIRGAVDALSGKAYLRAAESLDTIERFTNGA